MSEMRFTVYGHPRPKQRPRMAVSFRGRRMVARVYTPPETKRWEEHVRAAALAAGARPLDGPVEVEARVWVAGRRGDGDNLWKALADALNGVCWKDDSQIVNWSLRIHAAHGRADERVEIVVRRAVEEGGRR